MGTARPPVSPVPHPGLHLNRSRRGATLTQCPTGDGNPTQDGQSLCLECVDRLYSELRWLAACYPQLLDALTHRVHVEHVDRDKVVIVQGGGDPLKSGLDLHEDALQLRARIRRLTYQGLGWLLERGYTRTSGASQEVAAVLAETARNLHWILSDDDPDRVTQWAGMLIAARLEAEDLITPNVPVRKVWTNQECQHTEGGGDLCPGQLVIWGSSPVATCQLNPKHVVSRETLVYRLVTGKLQRS